MHITFSAAAARELGRRHRPGETLFKLLYDTDGCGCAVNGIARIVPGPFRSLEEGEALAAEDPYPVAYETRQEVFFEEELKLDYDASAQTFVLKSDSQFYNPHISL